MCGSCLCIKQSESYHDFADKRKIFGIPNFFDVMSNIIFFIVGIQFPLGFISIGMILTCFGSIYYHWNPNSYTLVFDRIPMTIVMAGIICKQLSYDDDYYVLIMCIG